MPKIKPNSTVTLYKSIPITDGQQIVFSSRAAQRTYFNKNVLAARVDCSYIKRNGTLRLQYTTSVVSQANYISFTNTAFENKTFYARITDYDYINNVTTEIRYEIDYFQSFMFDVQYFDGLIEREHMTETDWQLVDANPFRNDVYELLTAEDLTITKDMLKIIQINDENREVQIPDMGVNKIVLLIASWADETEMSGWKDIVEANSDYALYGDGTTSGIVIVDRQVRVPNPMDIIVIKGDNASEMGVNLNNILYYMTQKLVTMQILGVYYIGEKLIESWLLSQNSASAIVESNVQYYTGYTNKKLCRFPYQYLQCVTNDNIKEYQYERFTSDIKFGYVLSLDSVPVVSIIPYQYNDNYVSNDERFKYNMKERIDVDNIPQVAYTTDAYLAYVSQTLATGLANKTTYETDYYDQALADQMNVFDNEYTFSGTMSSLKNGLLATGNALIGNYQQSAKQVGQAQMDLYNPEFHNLADYAKGELNLNGDYINAVYGNSKPLYAADKYTPGGSSFISCYLGQTTTVGSFYLVNRRLNTEIGKVYDAYLSAYGNKSMRYGTPHVCDYITGGGNAPHFINGSTYCKTRNMHVISDMKMASDYIEAVFNSGHKFLKGEDL